MTTQAQIQSWDSLQDKLTARQQDVFGVVRGRSDGATLREIADALVLELNQVSGRVTELQALGVVIDSGRWRINPRSGKSMTVWVVRQDQPDLFSGAQRP